VDREKWRNRFNEVLAETSEKRQLMKEKRQLYEARMDKAILAERKTADEFWKTFSQEAIHLRLRLRILVPHKMVTECWSNLSPAFYYIRAGTRADYPPPVITPGGPFPVLPSW
jgi:hypothetical protein